MTEPNFVDYSWKLREIDPDKPVYLLMHCVTKEMDDIYHFSETFKDRLDETLKGEQAVPIVLSEPEGDIKETPGLAEQNNGIIGFIKNEYGAAPPDTSTVVSALKRDYPASKYIIGGVEFRYMCPLLRFSQDKPFEGCAATLLELAKHGLNVSVDLSLCVVPSDNLSDSYEKGTSFTELPEEYLRLVKARLAQLGISTEPY